MSRGIPEEIIDEIRQRTDLVELAGEFLKLERRGKNMVGLCPFHSEKTPSFSVSPEKQLFHCFGCGASGNAFSLVMQIENLSFPEAARFLARRSGVNIPDPVKTSPAQDSLRENIYRLNLMAARYYARCLRESEDGRKALAYLGDRGIGAGAVEEFMVGFAPDNWKGFFNFARGKGCSPELLVKAGLVSAGRDNNFYDRFRSRVVFPIIGLNGRVAGFGGRAFGDGEQGGPKYLNSPETPVFSKSSILYGLNLAREEIRRERLAVVMEGYTDVITAYQAGVRNAVASLGTALTAAQARLLRSQSDTVVTAYDADSAGEAATWRGLSVLQAGGCLVRVADLPPDRDPDDFIREKGPEAFRRLIEEARPLMEYRLLRLKQRYDLSSDRGREDYTAELLTFLPAAANQVEQDYYLKKGAEELGVDEGALRAELRRRHRRPAGPASERAGGEVPEGEKMTVRPAEKILISLMLQSKEMAETGRNLLEMELIEDHRVREVFETIWNAASEEKVYSAEKLINRFEEGQVSNLIASAATDPALQDIAPATAKRMIEDCVRQLDRNRARKRQVELQKKIKELEALGSNEQIEELLREHQQALSNKDGCPDRSVKGGDFNG